MARLIWIGKTVRQDKALVLSINCINADMDEQFRAARADDVVEGGMNRFFIRLDSAAKSSNPFAKLSLESLLLRSLMLEGNFL